MARTHNTEGCSDTTYDGSLLAKGASMRSLLARFVFGRGPHRQNAGKALEVYDRIGQTLAVAKDPFGAIAFGFDATRRYLRSARARRNSKGDAGT